MIKSSKASVEKQQPKLIPGVYSFLTESLIDMPANVYGKQASTTARTNVNNFHSSKSLGQCTLFDEDDDEDEDEEGDNNEEKRIVRYDVYPPSDVRHYMVQASNFVGRIFFENNKERFCGTCVLVEPRLVVTSRHAYPITSFEVINILKKKKVDEVLEEDPNRFDSIYAIFSIYGNPFTSHRIVLSFLGCDGYASDIKLLFFETKEPIKHTRFGRFPKIDTTKPSPFLCLVGFPAFIDEERSSLTSDEQDVDRIRQFKSAMKFYGTKIVIPIRKEYSPSKCWGADTILLSHPALNYIAGKSGFGLFKIPFNVQEELKFIGVTNSDNQVLLFNEMECYSTDRSIHSELRERKTGKILEKIFNNETQYSYHTSGPDRITLEEGNAYFEFWKVVQSNDIQLKEYGSYMTEKEIQSIVEYFKIKKEELKENLNQIDTVWMANSGTFKLEQNSQMIELKEIPPISLSTIFLSTNQTPQDLDQATIYTVVQPLARAWWNPPDRQLYIQVKGIVRYGWKIGSGATKTLPTKIAIEVKKDIRYTGDVIPEHLLSLSNVVPDDFEKAISYLRYKNYIVDEDPQLSSISIDLYGRDEEELKNLEHELNKIEFEKQIEKNTNRVTWLTGRRYSRMRVNSLPTRIDLKSYDPVKHLSSVELGNIVSQQTVELPYSEHVDFGVWRWGGVKSDFTFTIHHHFRNMWGWKEESSVPENSSHKTFRISTKKTPSQ